MAGRIPQSFINDLLDRVDIVDVIDARMELKKKGKDYSGLCPFHDEKTPSFNVIPDKQFYHCFGCQQSGTALGFIMEFDRLEFVEAVETLAAQLGLEVPREGGGPPPPRIDPNLYDVLGKAERIYRLALKDAPEAVDYLKQRGLTGEIARDFGIGYAPDEWQTLKGRIPGGTESLLLEAGLVIKNERGRVYDRFRGRIMFPIRDTRGRVIGFGGRVFAGADGEAPTGPKYMNSPETPVFHKSAELYGLFEARRALRSIDSLFVVEGYMDVVALAQHGVANSVATLGTATGEAHFKKLYRYTDQVICCFDGDNAGRQAAWKALENALSVLNEHRQLKLVFLPDGEDPDSLIRARGKAGFEAFVAEAMPGLEYLFSRLRQGLDLDTVDGQAKFGALINPYVQKVPGGMLRELLERKVAGITGQAPTSVPHPQPPIRRQQAPLAGNAKVSERLLSRLLTILVKYPALWRGAQAEERVSLLAAASDLGLFGEVLRHIEERGIVDVEELLIHFSDHPATTRLLELAQAPLEFSETALGVELREGITKLYGSLLAQKRREALAGLKDAADVDELRKYWRLHGLGNDYS